MPQKIVGVYSTGKQMLADLHKRQLDTESTAIEYFTAEQEEHQFLKNNTEIKGFLMESSSSKSDSGIHSLATAFDEDDGSVELMEFEKTLLDQGFSENDAQECMTYLHKGMIVAAERFN
ncbi:hypothetical protein FZC84_07450 [Rossellomorea vietnamensis]|uniref:Uncharacterized protein n=1 Tax=Rossellomorea vietnamensis TaxID=218284 RepID=A0A5D4MFU0_9BACI|nr:MULTISPECIES: hypothetical protein [Bacillaceae]TYS00368.1 hypothetical protein FZC84_07450 [Rossellomorea vietnamensis]